jgi:histidinol dehydrogenase
MTFMRIISAQDEQLKFLGSLESRSPGEDLEVLASVRSIVQEVKKGGTKALLSLRERFENIPVEAPLCYSIEHFQKIAQSANSEVRTTLQLAAKRVRKYHEIQKEVPKELREGDCFFQSRVQALDSVALYVPGGKAFYPSSVLMSAVPAQVAGVERIAIFTPARSVADPHFAATVVELGIETVFAVGGAQAVAAATFGLEEVPRFDKIVGPGNIYVATAKQMLAGRIGIDSFAGPSEILILADGTSNPAWIAADLLAQAEHDEEASSILVTTSLSEAQAVQAKIAETLALLKDREQIARKSLERWGAILVVTDRNALLETANRICPEHLHIHTACALEPEGQQFWTQHLKGVGAIFLGRYSAESFGDYLAGPSHVLPTAGSPRFASPLGVYDFIRRSSVISMSEQKAAELSHPTKVFAEAEMLWAHALSAQMRRKPTA